MHERYLQLLRRWFWLLIVFGVLGAVGGVFLLPVVFRSAAYDSSTTLGVTPFLSPQSANEADQALLASYAASVAGIAKSSQFLSRLQANLAAQGLVYSEAELPDKVQVKPDPGLPQVTIEAQAASQHEAEVLVREMTNLLMEEANARAEQVRGDVAATAQERTAQILTRLSQVYRQRADHLFLMGIERYGVTLDLLMRQQPDSFKSIVENLARISGDGTLAQLNAEADILEQELTAAQQDLALQFPGQRQAVYVLQPQKTVQTRSGPSFRKLDLMVGGLGGGLVLGWVVANAAEYARNGRGLLRGRTDGTADPLMTDAVGRQRRRRQARGTMAALAPAPAVPRLYGATRPVLLVAYPLWSFRDLYAFQKAVRRLHGVADARIQRFVNRVLELSVDLAGGEDLPEQLQGLAAFPHRLVEAQPDRVEILLETAEGSGQEGVAS